MKFVDLYSGIGGFRYALESFGNECVFSAEIDKHAIKTYKTNFNDNPSFDMDSISKMKDSEISKKIPDHDILVGGFPCQPFSLGGNKKGFADVRGTQFFNIVRILEIKKPKHIILENVKHLINHDNGNTFAVIKKTLKKLGYNVSDEPIILSPDQLGIPQKRERLFIVGSLTKKINKINTPSSKVKKIRLDKVSSTNLTENEIKYINVWQEFVENVKRNKNGRIPVIWVDEMLSKENDKNWQDWKIKYVNEMRTFYSENKKYIDSWLKKYNVLEWSNRKYRKLEWSSGNADSSFKDKHIVIRQSGLRIRNSDIFPTQVAQVETPIIYDVNIKQYRKLTIKEISRLQSFPNNFKHDSNEFQAYKQLGNAVNVEVVKWIYKEYVE